MWTHMVFFRLKEDKTQRSDELCEKLLAMRGRIPQLKDIEAGTDVLHSGRSFDVGLITRFDSRDSMEAYQVHPVHQEVLAFVGTVVETSVTVDFVS